MECLDVMWFFRTEVLPLLTAKAVYGEVAFSEKTGRFWSAPCPLHRGDQPTDFTIDTKTLWWTCRSRCGSGSVLAYLNGGKQPTEGALFDRVREAAALAGVDCTVPDGVLDSGDLMPLAAMLKDHTKTAILESFAALTHKFLLSASGAAGRSYLSSRGLHREIIDDFRLGLYKHRGEIEGRLAHLGYAHEDIVELGILDPQLAGQLVIPWRDRDGHISTVGVCGIPDDQKAPSDQTSFLQGVRNAPPDVFGLTEIINTKRSVQNLVLVDSVLDAIALIGRGFQTTAAIVGTAEIITSQRWSKLANAKIQAVTLVVQDGAGREGALKALEAAGNTDKPPSVWVAERWAPKELRCLGALIKEEGLEAIESLLEQRVPGTVYIARTLLGEVTPAASDIERRSAANQILEYIESLDGDRGPLDREDILRLTGKRTGYSVEALDEIASEASAKRKQKQHENDIMIAVDAAQIDLLTGANSREVATSLAEALSALEIRLAEPPPPFSVDRLVRESQEVPLGKSSGWKALDEINAEFNPGELTVVGARTGHCKSSFLVGIIVNWLTALVHEMSEELVVLYSAEEPEVRIFHRLLSLLTAHGIGNITELATSAWTTNQLRDWFRFRDSRDRDKLWPNPAALENAQERLREMEGNLMVVYQPGWTIAQIESHARYLSGRRPLGGIFVDYLQRIPPPEGKMDRRDIEVAVVGRALKSLAVDVSAPVIVAAQINREAVKQGDRVPEGDFDKPSVQAALRTRRPQLHQLREGGSEQEADLVLGLMNYAADWVESALTDDDFEDKPVEGPEPDAPTLLEVGALKNRYGEVGRWTKLDLYRRFSLIADPTAET